MRPFFKMGKFKRPSLNHGTTQSHQIFTFAKQTGVLVDYQVLSRSLYNWEEILSAIFWKIEKNSEYWYRLRSIWPTRTRPFLVASDFPHRTVLLPCTVPISCIIAEKALNMAILSKTGSRNMAETCAINFSCPTSYSTSIPIRGLSALLPFLMWAGSDLENFAQNRQSAILHFYFSMFITHYRKSSKPRETIFGSLVVRWVMYWYSLKHLLCSIYFADRWCCKCAARMLPIKHVQVGKFEKHKFMSTDN